MRTLALSFSISALAWGALAQGYVQGLVQFANGPNTLISTGTAGAAVPLPANSPGSYYFALLISETTSGPFTFTSVYCTNTDSAGRIGPGTYIVAPPGWACGTLRAYEVAGWSSSLGPSFNPSWLIMQPSQFPVSGFFGLSPVALGFACACDPSCLGPATPLFGGAGLPGFTLNPVGPWLAQPYLAVQSSGNQTVLSWTNAGAVLQSAFDLAAGFTNISAATSPFTNQNASPQEFFRLKAP